MDWTETKLLPALAPISVVEIDNAPYHSVKDPSSVSPTNNQERQYACLVEEKENKA